MANIATTKLSSKGQVVIPEDIRNRLGLQPGTQFVVVGKADTIVLKTVVPPAMSEFTDLLADARRQARQAGLKRSDITDAIKDVRAEK